MFSPELKKGSTEMLILSLLDARPRHGYEIGKLIEARSGGRLTFALRRSTRRCCGSRAAAG
jgi:DNA-binding PadR family transcriptional regulator